MALIIMEALVPILSDREAGQVNRRFQRTQRRAAVQQPECTRRHRNDEIGLLCQYRRCQETVALDASASGVEQLAQCGFGKRMGMAGPLRGYDQMVRTQELRRRDRFFRKWMRRPHQAIVSLLKKQLLANACMKLWKTADHKIDVARL